MVNVLAMTLYAIAQNPATIFHYERLGVSEYWEVNVATGRVIAFSMSDRRSGEIQDSIVLPGLAMATVETALTRSRTEDDETLWVS